MKKSRVLLVMILALAAIGIISPMYPDSSLAVLANWGLVATIIVALAIIAFLFEFEAMAASSKGIALIAMLTTISTTLRIPFAAIPSVQPCTYLIICTGLIFGPMAGFMVGALTALASNFFLGHGPWTLYQMFAWGLAGVTSGYFGRFRLHKLWLVAFGAVWGYLFGWITNTWFWASFIYPLTWETFVTYQISSFWFDTFHAIGNVLFLWMFGMKTVSVLERFRERFRWVYVSHAQGLVAENRNSALLTKQL